MPPTMTIGDFARATRLTAKALRFYHQAGILRPAAIDPVNGYRLYDVGQVADARVLRQLRALAVPVGTIGEILATSDVETRNALIAEHLTRLEAQLDETRTAVATLRKLLVEPSPQLAIEHRSVPATPALVVREMIDLSELGPWYDAAAHRLETTARHGGQRPAGPLGGIWDTTLFFEERGEAVLFIPVDPRTFPADVGDLPDRVRAETLPPVDLAVAVHRGPDETISETYAALGAYVAEHEIGVDGPLRETYLQAPTPDSPGVVTEIGWPIFRTGR
ncbi:MerR family transcriptional regulator [Plantibacter sp. YIM 135347]|uniref:MerR family transcriptional regulator n=1 Tax=Plantibacter sp. YIM 135347 TaxID=3423919 RepID=UPI003D34D5B2